jgi:hypothetical protein
LTHHPTERFQTTSADVFSHDDLSLLFPLAPGRDFSFAVGTFLVPRHPFPSDRLSRFAKRASSTVPSANALPTDHGLERVLVGTSCAPRLVVTPGLWACRTIVVLLPRFWSLVTQALGTGQGRLHDENVAVSGRTRRFSPSSTKMFRH